MSKTVSTKVQSYATGQTMQKRRSKKPKRSKTIEQEQKSKAKVHQPSIVDTPIEETRNVVFKPNEGPQTEFLAASEREVLYGGSAGGGKSYAMLADPLRYMGHPEFSGLLLRHTTEELRELIFKSQELYPKIWKGIKWSERKMQWVAPSGARLWMSYLDREEDVLRYQGLAFSWIGFDEITHLPTEFGWNYLASRLRTTNPEIKTYLRCTANPGGVGAQWVKKRYVEPSSPNTSFQGKDGLTRKFIPALLQDNPHLAEDGEYERMLQSLPAIQRKQLLEGNWDISEGAAFAEFEIETHVIPPFEIPSWWERLKSIDYGYAAESCCLWAVIDPEDKTIIIYRELYKKGLTGEALGDTLTEMEEQEISSITGVLDTAAWARTGYTGPTIGEILVNKGHKLRRADKNRLAGKTQIHEYLRKNNSTGRPKLQIFNTCINLIKELQAIPVSKTNPEDVDTHAADHAYDALRYLVMSRPRMDHPHERMLRIKSDIFIPSDETFGY